MFVSRAGSFLRSNVSRGATFGIAATLYANSHPVQCQSSPDHKPIPVLYQYKICPFCHRVKAYLDYLHVPYEVVEVDPLTKAQIKFSKDYQKVPIATIDGEVLPGSDLIIERVSQRFGGNAVQSLAAADSDKWMVWSGERLAILLYPNITRNFQESWECFEYAEQVDSWSALTRTAVRVAGPVGMLFANGKIKKKYNIVDERKELMDALLEWTGALQGPFLHGNAITMPDLMVFGVLRAVENTTTFREIMTQNQVLKNWYDAVAGQVVSAEVCAINRQ